MTFTVAELFDLAQTGHAALFDGCKFPWDALKKIEPYLDRVGKQNPPPRFPGATIGERVVIGEGTTVEPGAMIKGPAIIGRNCEIRHNAYVRDYVLIGDHSVIGNSCEFKHSLLFNGATVPHFSYVGDSILGYKAHLGAGVKISNVKLMPGNVMVDKGGAPFDTGLRKFGALLGDHVDIGCNSVLNPGSIIGRGSLVYPNTSWRGVLSPNMIVKNKAAQEIIIRRVQTAK